MLFFCDALSYAKIGVKGNITAKIPDAIRVVLITNHRSYHRPWVSIRKCDKILETTLFKNYIIVDDKHIFIFSLQCIPDSGIGTA